jgi:hypothetical protein
MAHQESLSLGRDRGAVGPMTTTQLEQAVLDLWALMGSNPQPSPCKGETTVLVRGLTDHLGVPVSTRQYL